MCDLNELNNNLVQNHSTCQNSCNYVNVNLNVHKHNMNEGDNNNYPGCPPMMADGRAFTDYRSASIIEQTNLHNSGHSDHHNQRQCDTNNGDKIIENINNHVNAKMQCNCCDELCQSRKQNVSQ